jgi:hypothetical protein
LFAACSSRDEVARVASPDGRVEAVLIERNSGATTSFWYEILLVDSSNMRREQVASLYGATRSDVAYGVNLIWANDRELVLEYEDARSQSLEKRTVRIAGRDIRTLLRPGVSDAAAPAGGMLYNLKRKK